MNFSNPTPLSSNKKKQSAFQGLVENISAIIGLVEGVGAMGMPKDMKKALKPKQRDKIVRWVIYALIWFVGAGIFQTFTLITNLF